MNVISTLLLFLALISCSKPGSNPLNGTVSDGDNNVVIFEEIQISVPLSGVPTAPVSLDFASLAFKQSGVQDLVISNNASSGTITYQASDFDSSLIAPFTIVSNNCLTPIGARKKCTISLSIANAASLIAPQTISSLFKVKGVNVNLSAVLEKDNTDYTTPVASVTVSPLALDFGTFKVGEFKELSIVVRNNSSSTAASIAVGTSSNPNIIISSNLCPLSLGARRNCTIKMKYAGVAAETFTAANLIKIANNQITYSGTVTSPSVLEPEVLSIVPATPSTSVAITQPNTQTGSIVFNNLGTLPLNAPVSGVSSDDGVVINSITCLGGLARSKSCTVNYTINSPALPSGVSVQTIRLQSGTVASGSFSINFNVTPNASACVLSDAQANGVSVLNSNSSLVGNKVGSDVSQCLLASNACNQYYSLATDSKSCQAVTSACSPADAQANGWNISQALTVAGSRAGGDISSCVVATCNNEYLLNASAKSCDAVACTLANAQGNGISSIANIAAVSGNISDDSCLATSCSQYFQLAGDSKSCVASTSACTQSDTQTNGWDISQTLTVSGNRVGIDVSACAIATCNNEYSLNASGKTCDAVACTPANAQGNGVSSILNVATVSGTINNDSCLVTTCNQYFKNAVDNKSCDAKLCTELNAGELTSLGYNLAGATISGTYNSCIVGCTSPLQQLATDGKSCEDKTPTGTISFAQDYTNVLTPNVLNITSSDSQSIQFYSNSDCSTTAGVALALPLSSTNLTLSPTDGVKNVYAKILNGTKSSECLTENIILDQTSPVLSVAAPALNSNIAGDSLTISGTCSEINSPTVSVGITLNGVTQNVNCAAGLFTSNFNIAAVPVGLQTISLSATDLAGNIGTASSSFNRINCTAFQTLAENSCTDNIPTGSIAFAQDSTKVLSPNVVNITSTNGQSIQFYSDASCSTTAGLALALPLASTNLTLSAGDGTKTAYAKLINGSASSACYSDSIVLDTTGPVIAILSPLNNANISIDSIEISGTCGDATSVDLVLSTITQSTACSSGSFSFSSVDISALVTAPYTLSLSSSDLLGNIGTASSSINRLKCAADQEPSGSVCVFKDVLNASISVTSPGQLYQNIGYMVSSSSVIVNSSLTENFSSALLFPSSASCQTYNTNNCHASLNVNCNGINPVSFVSGSATYTGLVNNIVTRLSAYYINGSKKSSCVFVDVFKNQPQAILTLDKPLEIVKHNHVASSAIAAHLAPVSNIKTIAATAVLTTTAALLTPTSSLLTAQDNIQTTESIPLGMSIGGSVSTTAGYFNDCLSATFQVPLSCTFNQEPLAQSIILNFDTFNIAEYKSDNSPLYLFLAPDYSVVVPYSLYNIKRITEFPVPASTITTIGMNSIQTSGTTWTYFIGGINSSSSPNTKLMRTNGTQVQILSNTAANIASTDGLLGTAIAKYKNKIYFRARNSSANNKIYEYDPATNILNQVSNMTATNDTFSGPIEFGNDLFFQGISTADTFNRLYRFDGTSFHKVTQLCASCNDINIVNQKPLGISLKNSSSVDKELVVSLAATNNITKTYSILQTTPGSSSYSLRTRTSLNGAFAEYLYSGVQSSVGGNNLYMSYSDNVAETASSTRYKLYKAALNTAATGTTTMINSIVRISNIHGNFNDSGSYGEAPFGLTEFNGSLYFNMSGGVSSSDFHLYRLDSTGNIKKISNHYPSLGETWIPSSTVINPDLYKGVACGGELYWPLRNSSGFLKLFKITGDKLVQVSNTNPGGSDNILDLFCESNTNTLYFKARSDINTFIYLYSLKKELIQ